MAGCWTVHRRSESRGVNADGSGEWVIDWDPAQPTPAPFTTIAWRTVHTAGTNFLYWEYAFGSASPTFDLELPGNAAEATRFLSDSQRQVTQTLAALSDSDLDKMVRHTSGGQRSAHRIVAGLDQRAGASRCRDQLAAGSLPLSELVEDDELALTKPSSASKPSSAGRPSMLTAFFSAR